MDATDFIYNSRVEKDLRETFSEMFPLADKQTLPSTIPSIKMFLQKRIEYEVELGIFQFRADIVRVLCEVIAPKTYVIDMVRLAVDEIHGLKSVNERLSRKLETFTTDSTKREKP